MSKQFGPGMRVITLCGELDTDHEGNERRTAPETTGWIESENHVDDTGVRHWDTCFPNGAAVVLSDDELRDRAQYRTLRPSGLRQVCLWIKHGYEVREQSALDDEMINQVIELADYTDQIIALLDTRGLLQRAQQALDVLAQDAEEAGYPARANEATQLAMEIRTAMLVSGVAHD